MKRIDNLFTQVDGGFTYKLNKPYTAVMGLGEKFDSINQKGKFLRCMVKEKCFYQGEFTYLSMPYFLTPDGFGIYVDTYVEVDFDFTIDDQITIFCHMPTNGKMPACYLLEGTPKQIIYEFRSLTSMPRIFPKWVLGAWMSSNRWDNERDVYEQLENNEKYQFLHNVLVIERWSDLTTHYLINGAKVPVKNGDQYITLDEMDFSPSKFYSDPKKLVDELHKRGIRVLFWLVPIYAQGINIEGDTNLQQVENDNNYVKQSLECVLNKDNTPYLIPHTWCIGSMIPDFTDKVGSKHWFDRFSYLLDLGIDGFKTDGGEFVHEKEVKFSDGTTGIEGQNAYPEQYTKAFADFAGKDRIVFSRSGGQNSPSFSVIWAGDQESTWQEYRSVIKAGISAGASGINCWGYDIAGFSGYLPTNELYLRAVQTATFLPVMQWHSDPVANNRCDFSGEWKINDRSPWNMSAFHKDENLLEITRKHFYLHYNLMPYLYSLMLNSNKTGLSSIRALMVEFFDDKNTYDIENQFMLGDALMVCPIVNDYISSREIYFPEGEWYDLFTGEHHFGKTSKIVDIKRDYTPVYVRRNFCLPLNLKDGKLFSNAGNDLEKYEQLTFIISGEGTFNFVDDLGNEIEIFWTKDSEKVIKNTKDEKVCFIRIDSKNYNVL